MDSRIRLMAACLLIAPYVIVGAQGIGDLIRTSPVPETLDATEVPSDFHAVALKTTSQDVYGSMFTFMTGFGVPDGTDPASRLDTFDLSQVSWTTGQAVKANGEEFLVTYKLVAVPDEKKGRMVPSRQMRLSLVRTDTITEISPRPDVTRERLAALFLPPTQTQSIQQARTQALSSMKQLALGMIMYTSDYDDVMPYAQDTKSAFAVIRPYLKNDSVFKSHNPSGSRVLYNMAVSGVTSTDVAAPAETVMFRDEAPWPDGSRLVAFMDGHVAFLDEERWRQAEKSLHLKIKRTTKPLPPDYWKTVAPDWKLGADETEASTCQASERPRPT